jgi:hypothetical protein
LWEAIEDALKIKSKENNESKGDERNELRNRDILSIDILEFIYRCPGILWIEKGLMREYLDRKEKPFLSR